jgi:O-antigen/teichoic acid export membrane protein
MVRRAYVMASLEQYLVLLINLLVLATMARILTPGEIGEAVTGLAVAVVAFSAREFVTPEFLIQRPTVDEEALRTALTLQLLVNAAIGAALFGASDLISRFYATPDLSFFLLLVAVAGFAEASAQPVVAILRRDMTFGTLAGIRIAVSLANGATTISLGLIGFGPISFAWGLLAGSVTLAALALALAPFAVFPALRPSLSAWREVLNFGVFKGAALVVERIQETVPQLILGRIASMTSVALYNRANALCGIPDRLIMSAFHSMAFPALANRVRDGHDIEKTYLGVLAYLSVLYWPGVMLVSLLAPSIVRVVLGPQWDEAVPVVRLLALSAVLWLPVIVTGPLLLALGQNRDAFLTSLISRVLAAAILCTASLYGVIAMALSQFIALPLQTLIALAFVHRHLPFSVRGLLAALAPGVVVTGFALVGPAAVVVLYAQHEPSLLQFALALPLAGGGWLLGLHVTRHPFLAEFHLVLGVGRSHARKLRQFIAASGA